MTIETLITDWGLPAVFLGTFAEGETAAILGGIVAHRGLIHWAETAAVAMVGAVLADQIWFQLARRLPATGRIGRRIARLRAKGQDSALGRSVAAHPMRVALACRFVPGTRILGPVLLAQTQLSGLAFLGLNLIAAAVWASLYTAIGYHFGRAAQAAFGRLEGHHLGLMLLGVALAGLGLHLCLRHRNRGGQG